MHFYHTHSFTTSRWLHVPSTFPHFSEGACLSLAERQLHPPLTHLRVAGYASSSLASHIGHSFAPSHPFYSSISHDPCVELLAFLRSSLAQRTGDDKCSWMGSGGGRRSGKESCRTVHGCVMKERVMGEGGAYRRRLVSSSWFLRHEKEERTSGTDEAWNVRSRMFATPQQTPLSPTWSSSAYKRAVGSIELGSFLRRRRGVRDVYVLDSHDFKSGRFAFQEHVRGIGSSSSSAGFFSSPQELFQFLYRCKWERSEDGLEKKKGAPSENISTDHTSTETQVSSKEVLRRALDRFIAWPPSPDIKNPALVKIACETAFAAGWFQRCCEVFFSSFPSDFFSRWETSLLDQEDGKSLLTLATRSRASSSDLPGRGLEEREGCQQEEGGQNKMKTEADMLCRHSGVSRVGKEQDDDAELTMFMELLVCIPPEVLQSAVRFFQVEEGNLKGVKEWKKGRVGEEDVDGGLLSSDLGYDSKFSSFFYSYSSARYLYQCLVVAHLLATRLPPASLSLRKRKDQKQCTSASKFNSLVEPMETMDAPERVDELEKIVGTGKVTALRLYFYSIWEMLQEERKNLPLQCSTSPTSGTEWPHERQKQQEGEYPHYPQSMASSSPSVSSLHSLPPSSLETEGEEVRRRERSAARKAEDHQQARRRFLRQVAKEAAAIFGVRHQDWTSCRIKGGWKGFVHSFQRKEKKYDFSSHHAEEDVIEASLRLLRYRWSSLAPQKAFSYSGPHLLLGDAQGPVLVNKSVSPAVPLFPSEELSSPQEKNIFLDALASLCVHLFRIYVQQEGIVAIVGQKEQGEGCRYEKNKWRTMCLLPLGSRPHHLTAEQRRFLVVKHVNPELSSFLLKAVAECRRWDLGEYLVLLLDQYWDARLRFMEAKSTSGTPAFPPLIITKSEEEALHQQVRYYMVSRQWMRALEWWSWLASLGHREKTTLRYVASVRASSDGAGVPDMPQRDAAPCFYPVPSVPLLATLARIAGEFATTNDYYTALRSCTSGDRSTSLFSFSPSFQERKRSLMRFHDPAALALWCLETMLHSQQPSPPTGNALFLAVTACAKAGLPEMEQVLQSLLENQVLALTEEEVLHARLLHCRRDIHWRERLETLVPLLAQIPSLPAHLPPTAARTPILHRSVRTQPLSARDPHRHSPASRLKEVSLLQLTNASMEENNSIKKFHSTQMEHMGSGASGSPLSTASPNVFVPIFPLEEVIAAYSAAGLSARNIFRVLLLLQEGNDPRFLPFYVYVRHIFTRSMNTCSFFATSHFPVSPLSRDQECRWLLLALAYTAANAQAVPKEWVWKIAADALQQLQDGPFPRPVGKTGYNVKKESRAIHSEWTSQDEQNDEEHEDNDIPSDREGEESDPTISSSAFGVPVEDHAAPAGSLHKFTAITPDTWRSLHRKWATLRGQYPYPFWESFRRACTEPLNLQEPSPESQEGVRMGSEHSEDEKLLGKESKSGSDLGWQQLLDLSTFTLLPHTCRKYLRVEEHRSISAINSDRNTETHGEAGDIGNTDLKDGLRFLTKKKRSSMAPFRECLPDATTMFHETTSFVSSVGRGEGNHSLSFLLRQEWETNWLFK